MGFLLIILLVLAVPATAVFFLGWWAGRAAQRRDIRRNRGVDGYIVQMTVERAWRDGFAAGRTRAAPARERGGVPVPAPAPVAPNIPAEPPAPAPVPPNIPPEPPAAAPGIWYAPAPAPASAGPSAPGVGHGVNVGAQTAATAEPPPPNPYASDPAVAASTKRESSEHRVLRNINITLYAAAMLLVAAASLSIGLAVPTAAKFTGLVVVTTLFYAAGLIIHSRSERLRPSATAFTGTGLALIPVAGLAFDLLVVHDARLAWLVTSLVGTLAFIYAAGRLRSRVLAALALTFIVSTTWSGGAVLNQGLIWYFITTMMLAGVSTVLAHRAPAWLDNIYLEAFRASHRYVVPATLAAAVFAGMGLDSGDYLVLFIVATGYYAAAAAVEEASYRALNLSAARVTATLALITAAVEFGAGTSETLRVAGVLLAVQAVLVSLLSAPYGRMLKQSPLPGFASTSENGFIRVELRVLCSIALVLAVIGNGRMFVDGTGPDPASLWSSFNWALLLVMAAMAVVAFRERGQMAWMVLVAGICSLLEPLSPAPWRQTILLTFSMLATALALRSTSGRNRAVLRIGLQALLPMAVGAVAGWAASGYFPDAAGAFPPSFEVSPWLVERASITGFALMWLVNVMVAAVILRLRPSRTGRGTAANIRVLLLPVGVLAGLICPLLVTRSGPSGGPLAGSDGAAQWLWVQPDWSELLTWAALAIALASASLVLGWKKPHGRSRELNAELLFGGVRPWAHITGVLGVLVAVPLVEVSSGEWAAEVVLGAGLVYAGLRSLCAGSNGVRGVYSLLAQACLVLGALQMLDYFDADWHAGVAVFAVTLAIGQLARLYLDRPDHPWQGIAFRAATGWLVLGVLAVLPLGYSAAVGSDFLFLFGVEASGVDQAALLVQLSVLALYGGLWWLRNDVAPLPSGGRGRAWLAMPVMAAVAGLAVVPSGIVGLRQDGWLPHPLWDRPAAVVMLLVVAGLLMMAEYSVYRLIGGRTRSRRVKMPLVSAGHDAGPRAVSIVFFILVAGAVAPTGVQGWQAVIMLLVSVGFALYATTLGIGSLVAGSVMATSAACCAATVQLAEVSGAQQQPPWVFPVSMAAAAALLYAISVAAGRFRLRRPEASVAVRALLGREGPGCTWVHNVVLSAGALTVLATAAVAANTHGIAWLSYAGCAALSVAAAAAVFEWPARWIESAVELAALVIAGCIHRVWDVAAGPVDLFWQAQYWVVVLILLAGFEYFRGRSQRGEWAVVAAAALLSASGLTTVIFPEPWQSAWTLTGHALLLVFGLLANRRPFVVWGAAGVGLGVVWYLRDYTFLLLSLLATGLIVLAVWRLVRLRARGD